MINEKSINIFLRDNAKFVDFHKHSSLEFVYVLDGYGILEINNSSFKTKPKDFLFYKANKTHRLNSLDHLVAINVQINPEFFNKNSSSSNDLESILALNYFKHFDDQIESINPIVRFNKEKVAEIEYIMKSILCEFNKKEQSYLYIIKNYINVLVTKLLRNLSNTDRFDIKETSRRINPKLLDHINKNYEKKLTLSDLASYTFYNPSYFGQIFKECFDISPFEYIKNVRMNEAARLLKSTKLSIEEIMLQVGIKDKKQFYSHFKSMFNITPGKYRKID